MAKDILITPANSSIEFKNSGTQVASIYESSGDLYLNSVSGSVLINGAVTLGDGLASNLEIGGNGTTVTMNFLGGGNLTSSGNALNIGLAGDIVNLNVSGVTYNLPSTLVTTSDYTDTAVLTKIKNVDGNGSGLDADLLKGLSTSSTNTANTVVIRDSSGNFSAGTITATLSGNASTASKLQTGRTIALSGAVSGSATFDGSGNITISTTIANSTSLGGTPTAPTAPVDTDTTQIATTEFVINQGYLKVESDTLSSVTGRGATTSTPTTFTGGVTSNSYATGSFKMQYNSITNTLDFIYTGS